MGGFAPRCGRQPRATCRARSRSLIWSRGLMRKKSGMQAKHETYHPGVSDSPRLTLSRGQSPIPIGTVRALLVCPFATHSRECIQRASFVVSIVVSISEASVRPFEAANPTGRPISLSVQNRRRQSPRSAFTRVPRLCMGIEIVRCSGQGQKLLDVCDDYV